MWRMYLKQVRYQLKENKFFSLVYILGTALSIAMVMMIIIWLYINTGNIGVVDKRDRMLYFTRSYIVKVNKDLSKGKLGNSLRGTSPVSTRLLEKYMYPLQTPEAKSIVGCYSCTVYNPQKRRYEKMNDIYTDAAFWKIFSMRFISGVPFNDTDVKSKAMKVVIDETTAYRLFGKTDVINYPVQIDWKEYRICGVVEDVPSYLKEAYAHIWLPYTSGSSFILQSGDFSDLPDVVGGMHMYILSHDISDQNEIRQEMEHQIQKLNAPAKDVQFFLNHQPDTALEFLFRDGSDHYETIYDKMKMVLIVLLVLLILPALNLSGLIVARMRKRAEEIAVRRAFGASTGNILIQILIENFIQMLIGGMLGICLSYGLFQVFREMLLTSVLNTEFYEISALSFWHIINFSTLGCVVFLCFLLNMISTLVPAWYYSRISIVNALNKK